MPSVPAHAAPRLPQSLVERTAVLDAWWPHRARTCHQVLGAAGSGKTLLALQWRARLVSAGFDVPWLSLQEGDEADASIQSVLTACAAISPDMGERLRGLEDGNRHLLSDGAVAASLIQAITQHGREVLVVVDGYQHAGHHRVHAVFQTMLDYAPANLHLLFISRAVPPLAVEHLAAAGQLHVLDADDLRFSLSEATAWVSSHAPAMAPEHIRKLHAASGGWITGLQLGLRGLDADQPLAREAAQYFKREVLPRLDAECLHALVHLAPTHSFNEQLALELTDSLVTQRLLALLQRERIFITPVQAAVPNGALWWCFHPLFRALLLERFGQMPQDHQQRTRLQLGHWFGHRGMLREAVQHLVAAGEDQHAADWVERHASALFLSGDLQRLAQALAALPDACLRARPALWQAWGQLCYRQFTACRATIAHMAMEARSDDAPQRAHLCLLRFSLALQHDDLDAAQALLPEMLELAHDSDAVLLGGRRHLLAWYFSHLGLAEEARERLQGPAHYLDDGRLLLDSCFGRGMTPVMRGLSHLHEGQYRQAESCLRSALSQAQAALGRHSEAASNAAGLLCEVLYEVNDHDGLRALLAQYAAPIERLALPDAQLGAALAASRLCARDGALAQAHAALTRLEDIASERGMLRISAIVLYERLQLCLQANADDAARAHLDALDALAQRALEHHRMAAPKVAHWHTLARARWHAHHQQDDAALALLQALASSAQLSAWLRIQAGALTAIVHARSGQPHAALRGALQVLQQAQTMGLARSLLDLGPDYLRLARQVQQLHADADPLLSLYTERLLHAADTALAATEPARAAERAALSAREQQILQLLVHDLPNRRIALALGVSTETVRWHLKNIFAKLSVLRRQEAIVVARSMGLQPGPLAP